MKLAITGPASDRTGYGLPLRVYALQTVLAREGHKTELVLYRAQQPRIRRTPIALLRATLSRMSHRRARRITQLRTRRFARFYEELKLTPIKEGALELVDMPAYDGYIGGLGEQVFDGSLMQIYTLTFARRGVPKVAYAVSSGAHIPTEGELSAFVAQAEGLTSLSVREPKLAETLAAYDVTTAVHADPVLLLSANDWLQHTASVVVPDIPYGVCHFDEKDPLARKTVSDLSRTYGVPIFNVSEHGISFGSTDKRFQNCDPRTFVKLIAKSAFCVGDTYLLSLFATLFQKPLLLLAREENRGTVLPLLTRFGREVCYVGRGEINEQVVKLMQQNTAARGLALWQNDSHDHLIREVERVVQPVENTD